MRGQPLLVAQGVCVVFVVIGDLAELLVTVLFEEILRGRVVGANFSNDPAQALGDRQSEIRSMTYGCGLERRLPMFKRDAFFDFYENQ